MSDTQMYAEEHEVDHEQSLGSLIKEIRDESISLFRQEVELVRTEIVEKVSRLRHQTNVVLIGSAVATAGLVVLLMGISQAITLGLLNAGMGTAASWISPVLVGLIVLIAGAAAAYAARKKIDEESIVPHKTAQTMKENKQWLKEKTT